LKSGAQRLADVLAVAGIGLVAVGQDAGGAQDFLGEGAGEFAGDEEVVQQSLFVFAGGDVDFRRGRGFPRWRD
jgi:hypothetical protein